MGTHEEKELDDFIRRAVVDAGLEEPAPEMKVNIMQAIRKRSVRIAYKALIPKRGWMALAICLTLFLVFVWINPLSIQKSDLDLIPFEFSGVMDQVSTTTFYAIGVFGLMVLLQVFLIKRRLDRDDRYQN